MESRHATEAAALKRAVLESPGVTEPALRMAAFSGDGLPDSLAPYLRKVRDESYKVTDRDLRALAAAGFSEDAIFELTLAAALGAADARLQARLRALGELP